MNKVFKWFVNFFIKSESEPRYDLAVMVDTDIAFIPTYIEDEWCHAGDYVFEDEQEWNLIPEHIRNNTSNE